MREAIRRPIKLPYPWINPRKKRQRKRRLNEMRTHLCRNLSRIPLGLANQHCSPIRTLRPDRSHCSRNLDSMATTLQHNLSKAFLRIQLLSRPPLLSAILVKISVVFAVHPQLHSLYRLDRLLRLPYLNNRQTLQLPTRIWK